MDVSAIILTWNSEKYIKNCLNSLISNLCERGYEYEIFAVDNGSNYRTVSMLKEFNQKYLNRIFPIYLETNTGTTYPRNLALKKVKGNFVLIMDSDVEIPHTGVIGHLADTIRSSKRTGLIAPRLNYPTGRLQKSTDDFPTVWTKIYRYFFLKNIENRENKVRQKKCLQKVDYAISAFWLIKKEVVKKVGLLDENIFYAPEDVDYCLRIRKAGYDVVYDPSVSAIHHTQEISRGIKMNRATLSHLKGLFYFFRKHKYIFRHPNV